MVEISLEEMLEIRREQRVLNGRTNLYFEVQRERRPTFSMHGEFAFGGIITSRAEAFEHYKKAVLDKRLTVLGDSIQITQIVTIS